jgi:Domain of unknown function (DUF5666)
MSESNKSKTVSGEEFVRMKHERQVTQNMQFAMPKPAVFAIIGIVLLGFSFVGGMQFQKSKAPTAQSPNTTADTRQFPGGSGGMNGMTGPGMQGMRPNLGDVTAVSDTSITIKNDRSNESQTFTINSDTKITNDGSTVAIDTIKTGDTVMVQADSDDDTVAARIILNPQMTRPQNGDAPTGASL